MAFVKLADNYTDLIGKFAVALLAEGVDRNQFAVAEIVRAARVALLAEGVDRNNTTAKAVGADIVALLAEGVDRNPGLCSRWR